MKGVSMVLKRYGDQYIAKHGTRMTAQQKKVLRAVITCREDSLGTIQYACSGCGELTHVPRSCCNRHCPACQHQRQQEWLASAQEKLLPCQYFLITFTLPAGLREFAMAHPKVLYAAMMSAAAQAVQQAATNPRHVGVSETGFTSVLHTWGRDLVYHPHVHVVVPAGGIDAGGVWQSSRASVFVPEQILERLFRGKLKHKLRSESFFDSIPDDVWKGRFVVDSEAVGNGESAVAYLAPYVMRGAVANRRVTQCDESTSLEEANLTLQVKRSGTRQYKLVDACGRVHSPLAPARFAGWLSSCASLRIRQRAQQAIPRRGSLVGRCLTGTSVRTGLQPADRDGGTGRDAVPQLWRPDDQPGLLPCHDNSATTSQSTTMIQIVAPTTRRFQSHLIGDSAAPARPSQSPDPKSLPAHDSNSQSTPLPDSKHRPAFLERLPKPPRRTEPRTKPSARARRSGQNH